MNAEALESLFARYVDHGDVDALGEVFDRAAPEILRVAVHLVGRPEDADDLVQSTFLTALERRRAWDRGRPLLPWLLGILEKHALELRRKRSSRRASEAPERVDETTPEVTAAFRETSEVFARALLEVPETYRTALLAYFRDGRKAVEIAEDLGVAPGTVRMRVHRGLELLKRALPAGAAVGVALTAGTARGLGAVRADVLRRGVELAPAAGSGGAALVASAGSAIMKGLGVAVALLVVAFALWRGFASEERSTVESSPEVAVASMGVERDGRGAEAVGIEVDGSAQLAVRHAAGSETGVARDDAWNAALVGFTGRLVDDRGKELAGLDVRLAELDVLPWRAPNASAPDTERTFVVDRTRSDDRGRFRVRGARPGTFRALLVDSGGSRGTLRILETAPEPGATSELGDVVLPEGRIVRGRVVEADGAALPMSRIVAVPSPARSDLRTLLETLATQDALSGAAIATLRPESASVDLVPMPRALRALADELPFPSARADERGEFVLEHVPAGEVALVVDHPSRVAAVVPLGTSATDAGAITLRPMAVVRGRVVDEQDAPVSGAELFAAAGSVLARPSVSLAVFHGGATSDRDGRFVLEGLPARAPLAIAVRRPGDVRAVLVRELAESGDVEVRLERRAAWTVVVRGVDGRAVAGAEVEFTAQATDAQRYFGGVVARAPIACDADGRARMEGLPRGGYVARARAPGHAELMRTQVLEGQDVVTEIVLPPGRALDVTVLSALDERPVQGARVSIVDVQTIVEVATDELGHALLARPAAADGRERRLVVEHPAFAQHSEALLDDAGALQVRLDQGGAIEARVRCLDQPAQATLLFVRAVDGASLLARADLHGTLRVTNLAAGEWRYFARESMQSLGAILGESRPPLASGQCTVEAGKTTRIDVQVALEVLRPDADAALSGRVRIDGEPGAGLRLQAFGRSKRGWSAVGFASTDERGHFRFAECPSGAVRLLLFTESTERVARFFASYQLEVDADAKSATVIDLTSQHVNVRVLDAEGAPLEWARVSMTPTRADSLLFVPEAMTDAEGRAELRLCEEGAYRIAASKDGQGSVERAYELHIGPRPDTVELRLSRGVLCRGVARLAGFVPDRLRGEFFGKKGDLYRAVLTVHPKGEASAGPSLDLDFVDGSAAFELVGLQPGTYVATATANAQVKGSKPIEFTLGAQGDGALELVLHAMD